MYSNAVFAKKNADVIKAKEFTRSKPLKLTISASFFDPNLLKINTENVWQILR